MCHVLLSPSNIVRKLTYLISINIYRKIMSNEIYKFPKSNLPKMVQLPLCGDLDCYMEISIQEVHAANCSKNSKNVVKEQDKKNESFVKEELLNIIGNGIKSKPKDTVTKTEDLKQSDYKLKKPSITKTDSKTKPTQKVIAGKEEEVKPTQSNITKRESKQMSSKGPINANDLIPTNNIDRLNGLLAGVIYSLPEEYPGYEQLKDCDCAIPFFDNKLKAVALTNKSQFPDHYGKEDKDVPIQEIVGVSPKVERKVAPKMEPIIIEDAKLYPIDNIKLYTNDNTKTYLEDVPQEGSNPPTLVKDPEVKDEALLTNDIDEIASTIYNPEEREKKLKLLRLLIQEALPPDCCKGHTQYGGRTIEIPATTIHDLKNTDSIIIRIIVEK